jgi:hypothetical protein
VYDDVTYVYDDVTYVYDDVTYVYGDVTYVYDDVTYVYDDVTYVSLSAQRSWRRSERNSRQRGAQVAGACRTMSRSSIRTWRSWTRRLCRPRPT